MNEAAAGLAGGAAVTGGLLLVGGGMLLLLKRSRAWWRSRFREPFHEGILRPPGWGCLERRQDALFDFATGIGALPIAWAGLSYVFITDRGPVALGCAMVGLPLTVAGIRSVLRAYRRARSERLGFLGECAVSEALGPLLAKGWRVFHDLPMESDGRRFNIDHIAVGRGGVWAIETKTFSKAVKVERGADTLKVIDECVVLPDGRKREPLRQARGIARALQVRLNDAGVGVRFVEPLVMLPGWTVSYPKGATAAIRDPRNVVAFLAGQPERLGSQDIERISQKLEEWCRVLWFERGDA